MADRSLFNGRRRRGADKLSGIKEIRLLSYCRVLHAVLVLLVGRRASSGAVVMGGHRLNERACGGALVL